MTPNDPLDLLDLAEAVARGDLRADDAERRVRETFRPDRDDARERAVHDLHDLTAAASLVRLHASATREAFAPASADVAQASPSTSIQTAVAGVRVGAGAARRPSTRGDGRAPRRTWLLVAATLLIGTGVVGAAVVGGRLTTPNPAPSVPAVAVATASPEPSAIATVTPSQTTVPATATSSSNAPTTTVAGSLGEGRVGQTATLLPDGRVLVVGGLSERSGALKSAELWDPSARTFAPAGSLATARISHTATLLGDGRVLIVGGDGPEGEPVPAAEIWDPATRSFSAAASTVVGRGSGHTATRLPDGRVLIIGGVPCHVDQATKRPTCALDEERASEIWDPATEAFSATGSVVESRSWQTATLLPGGRVLVVGGTGLGATPSATSPTGWTERDKAGAIKPSTRGSAEIWDPATETFSRTGSPRAYRGGGLTATLLLDGRVLIVGGETGDLARNDAWYGPQASAEIWDPASGRFTATGSMARIRYLHTATRLSDGRVLVVGGTGERSAAFVDTGIAETEIWDPATGSFEDSASLAHGRLNSSAVLLPDGRILVLGGSSRVVQGANVDDIAAAEILGSTP